SLRVCVFGASARFLGEFHDYRVDGDAVARLDGYLLDDAVALGAQDVLHLHRLDDSQGFARLDLLAFGNGDRNNQARHRAAYGLFAAGEFLYRHQTRIARFTLSVDERFHFDAAVGEFE